MGEVEGGKGQRTARITNSMNALCGERERKEDIAAAQDEVSSVVVLDISPSSALRPIVSHPIPSYLIRDSSKGDRTVSQTPH